MNIVSIALHFGITFVVCMVVLGACITFKNRFTHENGHAYWLGVMVFSLLAGAAVALLNLGR